MLRLRSEEGMTNRAFIVIPLNQLTLFRMFRFMGEGKLPDFKRPHEEPQVSTTDAQCC